MNGFVIGLYAVAIGCYAAWCVLGWREASAAARLIEVATLVMAGFTLWTWVR